MEKKKKISVTVQKKVLWNANYDLKNNDFANVLRQRHFKWCDFPKNSYEIVLHARHFLPVGLFPKYYFNKLCFELPQNMNNE